MQKEVEKHFTRGELRRVAVERGRRRSRIRRASRESYASDLLRTLDVERDPRARASGIVVDYGFSAASYVLPLVLGPLGVEVVAAHAFPSDGDGGPARPRRRRSARRSGSSPAVGADLGAVFDRAGERLYLDRRAGARDRRSSRRCCSICA